MLNHLSTLFMKGLKIKIILHLTPVDIYLLKVNNRKARTRCEICSKLTISVFIVNFEHVIAGWDCSDRSFPNNNTFALFPKTLTALPMTIMHKYNMNIISFFNYTYGPLLLTHALKLFH